MTDHEVNKFTLEALFSTLTNVDFDTPRFRQLINRAVGLREGLKAKVSAAGGRVDFTVAAAGSDDVILDTCYKEYLTSAPIP